MSVIGIDPGLSGAIAVLSRDGLIEELIDMPTTLVRGKQRIDPHRIIDTLAKIADVDHVVLEEVGSRPGMGSVSAFTFGHGYGLVQGVLVARAVRGQQCAPQAWTKALGVGSDKGFHRTRAMSHFPYYAASFERARDDGRADAALLALYGLRHIMGMARS